MCLVRISHIRQVACCGNCDVSCNNTSPKNQVQTMSGNSGYCANSIDLSYFTSWNAPFLTRSGPSDWNVLPHFGMANYRQHMWMTLLKYFCSRACVYAQMHLSDHSAGDKEVEERGTRDSLLNHCLVTCFGVVCFVLCYFDFVHVVWLLINKKLEARHTHGTRRQKTAV